MSSEETIFAVPYGIWDAEDGTWYHNPNLSLTEEEQREHNIKHGFKMKIDNNE